MGIRTSKMNAFLIGDTLNNRYDIYKMLTLDEVEYFKVEDLMDFNVKKASEPIIVIDEMSKKVFKLINKLNHPNIIKVDYFYDDGYFYAIRTYDFDYYGFAWRLQIQRHLETRRKHIEIEEEQIIYWLMQLLNAISCLHKNNILHKFIIPEAISFKKDKLKLFVPARSCILESKDHYLKEKSTWLKCPEMEDFQAIGLKYDIWSAGWTLYNFAALEDGRFVLNEVESFKEWTRPDIPRHYTREVDRIFKKMTIFDPDLRPDADELLKDRIFDQFRDLLE